MQNKKLNRMTQLIGLILFVFSVAFSSTSVKTVENFTLNDYNEKGYNLADFKDSKAVVVMFVATRCPVSNAYNERMNKIYDQYAAKGVTFLAINSNKLEHAEEVKKHAEENKFKFPVLKDPNNKIANKFKASVTPEVFVLNSKLDVLYHGRIDDSRREDEVKVRDLNLALDEILAGKAVTTPESKAFGCTIKRIDE